MKVAALLIVGSATLATVQAQSASADIEMLPMPKTLPLVFFAPEPLAGAMLEPLALPAVPVEPETAPEVEPDLVAAEPVAPAEEESRGADLSPEIVAQADPELVEEAPPAAAEEPPAPAEPASGQTIVRVIVENVESNNGVVNVAVCDTDFSPEGCPYQAAVPASQGFVEALFQDVPPGAYAVVGYHDVNNNDEFDKFLGVPREPYALSGDAAKALVPEFQDAVLDINQGENYVIIRMKRLGSG